MYKKAFLTVAVMLAAVVSQAQWSPRASDDSSRVQVHLSTGFTAAAGFGRSDAAVWTAPSVSYQASDRLTLHGGFAAVGSLLGDYGLHGIGPRSLAPRRQGTRMVAATVGAEYRVSDRLALWASVTRLSGFAQPLWLDGSMPVEATAFSGGLAYQTATAGLLEFHFHIVRDHYGNASMGPWGHPWCGPYTPGYGLYHGPWSF